MLEQIQSFITDNATAITSSTVIAGIIGTILKSKKLRTIFIKLLPTIINIVKFINKNKSTLHKIVDIKEIKSFIDSIKAGVNKDSSVIKDATDEIKTTVDEIKKNSDEVVKDVNSLNNEIIKADEANEVNKENMEQAIISSGFTKEEHR